MLLQYVDICFWKHLFLEIKSDVLAAFGHVAGVLGPLALLRSFRKI